MKLQNDVEGIQTTTFKVETGAFQVAICHNYIYIYTHTHYTYILKKSSSSKAIVKMGVTNTECQCSANPSPMTTEDITNYWTVYNIAQR